MPEGQIFKVRYRQVVLSERADHTSPSITGYLQWYTRLRNVRLIQRAVALSVNNITRVGCARESR